MAKKVELICDVCKKELKDLWKVELGKRFRKKMFYCFGCWKKIVEKVFKQIKEKEKVWKKLK